MKYMVQDSYVFYWRYRITGMVVYLLDENGKVIPNFGENKFRIGIQYPNLFYDMDSSKVAHLFGAHPFKCTSTYKEDKTPLSGCKVSHEFLFAGHIYSPSPNGTFTFSLRDSKNKLDLTKVHKFRIEIKGSRVEFTSDAKARKSKWG